MLKLQTNEKNDVYIFSRVVTHESLQAQVSRGSYRTTSRNRLVNLWYMTNIPVLEREEMLVNKLGIDVLLLFKSVHTIQFWSNYHFKFFLCMLKNVIVHTIQFSHPIISRYTLEKHDNSCFENLGPFHRS